MSDQDDCSPPEVVHCTKDGKKITISHEKIQFEGNNNILIKDCHDMTVNVVYEKNQHEENTKEQQDDHERHERGNKPMSVMAMILNIGSYYANNVDGKCEETDQEAIERLSEFETWMRKEGQALRCITSGSLKFTVAVHDTYALENLMENHKNGKFIQEFAKIFVAESEIEHFCKTWSSHIDENMHTAVLSKLKACGQRQMSITEWGRNQVREWLLMELRLEPEIANQIYEQEFIGRNLLICEEHEEIFKKLLQTTDLRMIQYGLEERKVHKEDSWEPITDDCSATRVSELLLQIGLPQIHAEKFANMRMTGFKFLKYRKRHLMEDFNLTIGPLMLVLHMQKISQDIQKMSIDTESNKLPDGRASTVAKSEIQNEEEIGTAVKYLKDSPETRMTSSSNFPETISPASISPAHVSETTSTATAKKTGRISEEDLQPEVPSSPNKYKKSAGGHSKVEDIESTAVKCKYVREGTHTGMTSSNNFPTNIKSPTAVSEKEDNTTLEDVSTTEKHSISMTYKKSRKQLERTGTNKEGLQHGYLKNRRQGRVGEIGNTGARSKYVKKSSETWKTGDSDIEKHATVELMKSTKLEKTHITEEKDLQPELSTITHVSKTKNTTECISQETNFQSTKRKSSKTKKKSDKSGRPVSSFSEAEHKIRELLLGDSQLKATFDVVYDAILVVNVPGTEIQNVDETFEFISKVKWKAVFDFDAKSNLDGTCKVMRSKQEVNLYGITDLAKVTSPAEINYAEVPTWIFCNGRTDIETSSMDRMTWIKKRCQYMDKAIEFFSNASVIRQDTGLVIFILFRNNMEVLSEAFRKFYTDFGIHRIVFICETTEVFKEWCKLVTRYCTPEELRERLVVVPLESLNDIILRMQGVNVKCDYILPTVDGKCCSLWEKDKSKWVDLSVITYNECDNTDMNKDHPDFHTFRKDTELEFYRGEKLSFWNFKFNDMSYNHVCQRNVKFRLVEEIDNTIKQPTQQVKILWFHLFHQPGAGGSTVVKHILWEFRQRYRCILLNKITDQTEAQILDMWNYGERDYNGKRECLPLVIVSDNLSDDDLTDMVISLEYKIKNIPGRTCIVLNCKRYISQNELPTLSECQFILEQSLHDNEKQWFQTKHNQLEKRKKNDEDFEPDRLLAFMVMKEDFKPDYVENAVKRVLDDLKEHHPREFELVKFCSLFSKFARDTTIPIPCCDEFIGFEFSARKGRQCPWEHNKSEGCSLLMITVDINEVGSVQGLKIVHPIVADCILQEAESLSSLVTHFLKSKLLTAKSHSREYLAARTHDLLIKRNQTGIASTTKQQFSALILAIQEVNKEDACNVLIEGFHILDDPMIAQQIARYYNLEIADHSKALEFIERAINMRRDNTFLWDTKGQIYKKELIRSFYSKIAQHELLSIDDSSRLLKLAFNGINSFHKSQEIDNKKNMSSVSGELDITFKMLDILACCLDIFQSSADNRKILQLYLVDKNYKPDVLGKWAEYHIPMKGLMGNIHDAIDTMTNYLTFQKEWSNFTQVGKSEFEDVKSKITSYVDSWKTHFGCINISDNFQISAETANDLRRLEARKLGGYSSKRLFQLEESNLLKIRKLLLANNPYSAFDLRIIIFTNLALSGAVSVDKSQYDLPPIKEMIYLAKEFDQCDQKEGYNSLYAPLFLLMLLWPRGQPEEEYDNNSMKKALKDIRHRWSSSQRRDKQEDGQLQHHPLYGRHLKNQRTRKKPMVHFFLGSGKGLRALVHQSKISSNPSRLERDIDQVWKSSYVSDNLLKVEGILSENNNIIFKHKYTDESIQFPLASTSDRTIKSREEVVFYIGFSWGGPVAYYVKPKATSHLPEPSVNIPIPECRPSTHPKKSTEKQVKQISALEYQKECKHLKRKLTEIQTLKAKAKQGKILEKNQKMKLDRERDLEQQLRKLEEEFKKQIEMSSLGGE